MNWLEGAGTVAQLLAGGAVGVLLTQAYENYRFIQNRTLGLRGDWLGEWQTFEMGEEDRWEPAKVNVVYRLGWISVAFQPSQDNRAWKARLKSTPDHGLAGRWKSTGKSAEGEGSMALIVSPDGTYCFGTLLGMNSAGQRRIQNVVLARDAAKLHRAKAIFFPSGIFAEEQILAPLRKKYYQYHSTVVAGRKIWIASCLDFSIDVRPGFLFALTTLTPSPGNEHVFEFKGLLSGDTLILIVTGVEFRTTPNVWIYPQFTQVYLEAIPGIMNHYTWDMSRRYSQCLIRREPLLPNTLNGDVGEQNYPVLEDEWRRTTEIITPFNFSY